MNVHDKRQVTLRVMQEVALTYPLCQRDARVGLFIVGAQGTYYNALNAPNHLLRQWSARPGGGG
jgi:hypothetical protein